MALEAGTRLGSYEISEPLGRGGMGHVFRARDLRLDREVALKILPEEFASDRERLRRFERESQAILALSHPNIVAIYDVGEDPVPYIAMELVEGRTLREILAAGPVPTKRLLEIGTQVAEGLARAHEAGIVHRDVKPENVMVSRDGAAKLLDFGLAKRTLSAGAGAAEHTVTLPTEPGAVLGTVRYMSPEQATGRPVDFRTDQFSLGSVLYEMASGRPAFSGETNVDTLSAILHAEPQSLGEVNPRLPPPLGWIIERCHAKSAGERYAATADLARDLRNLRDRLLNLSSAGAVFAARPRRRVRAGAAVGILAALAAAGLAYWLGARRPPPPAPRIRQITLQGGAITTARFTPGGQSVVYATQWEGRRPELFEVRLEHPESRSMGIPAAQVLSISRSGFLAIALLPPQGMTLRSPSFDLVDRFPLLLTGTLAQLPLAGGAPRELLENVFDADWAPNGRDLAVTRFVNGRNRLEYPIGRTLFEHFGWIVFPRVSPDGERVAFCDQGTNLYIADRSGSVKPAGVSVWEHTWWPPSEDLLYTEFDRGSTDLRALATNGKTRSLTRFAGYITLYDASAAGTVLAGHVSGGDAVYGSFPDGSPDRRLFQDATLEDVSGAGDLVTYAGGDTMENEPTAYLGRTDGSPPKRLGALGRFAGAVLSPDGKFVVGEDSPTGLTVTDPGRTGLFVVPTGSGPTTRVPTTGLTNVRPRGLSSDGRQIYIGGAEPGHGLRLWVVGIPDGVRRPLTGEDVRQPILSPDASQAVGFGKEGWSLYPTGGGEPRRLPGILPGEEPIQWTADGKLLYVRGADEVDGADRLISARVFRLDPKSGARTLWKRIPPVSPSTGGGVGKIQFSADGRTCFFTHHRFTAELYVLEGLR